MLYDSGPYSFGAGLSARGPGHSLGGKVQEYAGAVFVVGNREGCGSFCKRTLYGELFGGAFYRKRGWSIWERAPVLAHQGSPSGGDRVIGSVRHGGFLA